MAWGRGIRSKTALQAGLVALDKQEVVRAPAAVVFSGPGDVLGGLPLSVGRVGGDDRFPQVHVLRTTVTARMNASANRRPR
jgi:hypothetical protein